MEYVAYSCCKQNKGMNGINDAQAYEMQVQLCEPNTWGVTGGTRGDVRRASTYVELEGNAKR
jgi:hypothetical protein